MYIRPYPCQRFSLRLCVFARDISSLLLLRRDHRLRRAELGADAAAVAKERIDLGIPLFALGHEAERDAPRLEAGLAAHAGGAVHGVMRLRDPVPEHAGLVRDEHRRPGSSELLLDDLL